VFVRKQSSGELMLINQTDHSRFVGQLASHWGNRDFARPEPYESVARAATYHDFGWLSYETNPFLDTSTGEPFEFRKAPFSQAQLDSYQWCIDWLAGIDSYSGLLVGMHRTGLWKGRYGKIAHPGMRYNPQGMRPEIQQFIDRNEAWQERQRAALAQDSIWVNYHLLQVWDLLGLYFCCQEPYGDHIEPVPIDYSPNGKAVRVRVKPVGAKEVSFEPFPFDARGLKVQLSCKRLPQSSFADLDAFRTAYFQGEPAVLEYSLV
jgi:hypothetical protein